jgi:hypothetical protein
MASLLYFLLFIFLFGLIVAAAIGLRLYRTVHNVMKNVKNQSNDFGTDSSSRRRTYNTTTTETGETIIDQRDPEKIRQKIFKDDEGEYIDFKEEK